LVYKGDIMTKFISKRKISFAILLLFCLVVVGMLKIERYKYYQLPSVNTSLLDDESNYKLMNTQIIYDESNSSETRIDIYKSVQELHTIYDLYAVLVTVTIDQDDDNSTKVVSEYDSIKNITIQAHVDEDNTPYLLADYMMPEWGNERSGFNISFNFNNLIGRKDISTSTNQIGYIHSGSNSVEGIYQGNFDLHDYTSDCIIQTVYYVDIPKDEELAIFNITYKIDMEHMELYPFSIKKSTITGDWKEATLYYPKES